MRHSPTHAATVVLAAAVLAVPASASAQIRLLMEAGISSPSGDFAKEAEAGYHVRLGLQSGVPRLPLSFRAEGEADRFTSNTSTGSVTVVSGSASAVLWLGGVGTSPYLVSGIGQYRTSFSDVGISSATGTGYHVGVGIGFGAGDYGVFLEARMVNVKAERRTTRYFPISLGLRL